MRNDTDAVFASAASSDCESKLGGLSADVLNRYRNPDGTLSRSAEKILECEEFWQKEVYDPYKLDPEHWDGRSSRGKNL